VRPDKFLALYMVYGPALLTLDELERAFQDYVDMGARITLFISHIINLILHFVEAMQHLL
jgi:hypothetical protein